MLLVRWLAEDQFYPDEDSYMPVPDPDAEAMDIREWTMQPGDAVALISGFCMAPAAMTVQSAAAPFRCGLLVMMPAMLSGQAEPHPRFRGMGWCRGKDFVMTGFLWSFAGDERCRNFCASGYVTPEGPCDFSQNPI